MIGLDPPTMALMETAEDQADVALRSLANVLQAYNMAMQDSVGGICFATSAAALTAVLGGMRDFGSSHPHRPSCQLQPPPPPLFRSRLLTQPMAATFRC